jgi:crotonobetainyl-CoA:carnitine CoA-transferase CaiB-like acyl-CoA transferase
VADETLAGAAEIATADGAPGAAGPLAGVRVLELGTLIAGPFAARLLGDFGAEVIKVEAPRRGDPLREWGAARHRGRSLWWPVQSRGKKLVTLDLRTPRGAELCRRLVGHSDVLIENFRPGTLERWGLGPDELLAVNPALIVVRVSGFGQTGPYAARPGFASAGEAMGGLRHLNGFPGEAPPRVGLSLGDSLTGLFAAWGATMALYHRDARGGRGQVVDASILDSCVAMLESIPAEYAALGAVRGPSGTGVANIAPSNLYRSRDGKWLVIAANNDNLWPRLCRAMNREDLLADDRFATHQSRGAHGTEIDAIVAAWAAERDAAEIDRILTGADVVCAPVNTIADLFSDPHASARQLFAAVADGELGDVIGPAPTPRLSDAPARSEFTSSWELGRHNDEVFGEMLGLEQHEIEELREAAVI